MNLNLIILYNPVILLKMRDNYPNTKKVYQYLSDKISYSGISLRAVQL